MNQLKQFWAILKFQMGLSCRLFIFLVPLAMIFLFNVSSFVSKTAPGYHPDLGQLLNNNNQNLFIVLLFGCVILAPEVSRAVSINALWPSGTEFLLTRAVDRRMVFRVRTALFYSLLVATIIVAIPFAIMNPDIQIHTYSAGQQEQTLAGLPGSMPYHAAAGDQNYANDILIPNGALLEVSFRFWMLLSIAIVTEWYVMLIYPLKYRRFMIWGAYFVIICIPLSLMFHNIGRIGGVAFPEKAFFIFATHQPAVWFCTIAALLLGQLWCERRFANTEH